MSETGSEGIQDVYEREKVLCLQPSDLFAGETYTFRYRQLPSPIAQSNELPSRIVGIEPVEEGAESYYVSFVAEDRYGRAIHDKNLCNEHGIVFSDNGEQGYFLGTRDWDGLLQQIPEAQSVLV